MQLLLVLSVHCLVGEEFDAPADTLTTFTTDDDCVFAFANPSTYYYDVCYATVVSAMLKFS